MKREDWTPRRAMAKERRPNWSIKRLCLDSAARVILRTAGHLLAMLVIAGCTGRAQERYWDHYWDLLYSREKAELTPATAVRMLRLTGMPGDESDAYFLDDSTIIFCHSVYGNAGYRVFCTDTAGASTEELVDLKGCPILSPPLVEPGGGFVAFTQGRDTLIALSQVSLTSVLPRGVRAGDSLHALASDVTLYDLATDKAGQLTSDGRSEAVKWLARDTLLVMVRSDNQGDVVVLKSGAKRLLLNLNPISYRIYDVPHGRVVAEFPYRPFSNIMGQSLAPIPLPHEVRIRLLDQLKLELAWLFPVFFSPIYFRGQDSAWYRIANWDTCNLVLMKQYRTAKSGPGQFDIILAEFATERWSTLVSGLSSDQAHLTELAAERVLTMDTSGSISIVRFDGSKKVFARVSGPAHVRGLAASKDGKRILVSASLAGTEGADIFMFSKGD